MPKVIGGLKYLKIAFYWTSLIKKIQFYIYFCVINNFRIFYLQKYTRHILTLSERHICAGGDFLPQKAPRWASIAQEWATMAPGWASGAPAWASIARVISTTPGWASMAPEWASVAQGLLSSRWASKTQGWASMVPGSDSTTQGWASTPTRWASTAVGWTSMSPGLISSLQGEPPWLQCESLWL